MAEENVKEGQTTQAQDGVKEVAVQQQETEEERLQREAQELKQKINAIVNDFLNTYFVPMETFIEEEIMFAMEAGLEEPKVDYFGLRRFLTTAINTMCDMDENIMCGLLDKLNKDLDRLFKYYDTFRSKNKITKIVFENDFLTKVPMYVELLEEVETTRSKKSTYETKMKSAESKIKSLDEKGKENLTEDEIKEYKMYKKQNADCVHHFAEYRDLEAVLLEDLKRMSSELQNAFIPRFDNRKDAILVDLKAVINKKSYYLDKALWYYSANSKPIKDFFEKADIKGTFSLKTYLEYYLRNVDMEKSKNSEWHQYLHEVMEVLE